ncbi:hypothetical protein ACB092_09G082200 [Castanea dentata]
MTPYLTNVWRLNITHAAAIVNVFSGVATIMPIGMAFLIDAFMGDYWMLLLSSLAYSFGLSLLAMSTPPILSNAAGNCGAYKPDCIGDAQMVLFYTALAFLAIGISGHITSLDAFLKQQDSKPRTWQAAGGFIVILLAIVGFIAIQFIKPWSVRFGMPAIYTVVATFLFTTGSFSYKRRRELCNREEVEDTKNVIRMIPMWMTFIMCGVVISIGNTYFLEQAKDMNQKVGKWKIPLPIFKLFYDLVKEYFPNLYVKVTKLVIKEKYIPPCGIAAAMLFSILCCITAVEVETRRLDVVKRHLLLNNSNDNNEKIPMSMFWLLPQFLLLGAVEGISKDCIDRFFTNQAPTSMKRYLQLFSYGVIGAGTVGSVLSVYVVGQVSGSGGKRSWFQDTLDKSRLDNYYWTLTALSSANLILYILVALFYTYKDPPSEEPTQP